MDAPGRRGPRQAPDVLGLRRRAYVARHPGPYDEGRLGRPDLAGERAQAAVQPLWLDGPADRERPVRGPRWRRADRDRTDPCGFRWHHRRALLGLLGAWRRGVE